MIEPAYILACHSAPDASHRGMGRSHRTHWPAAGKLAVLRVRSGSTLDIASTSTGYPAFAEGADRNRVEVAQ